MEVQLKAARLLVSNRRARFPNLLFRIADLNEASVAADATRGLSQEGFYLTRFAVNSWAAGPNTGGRPVSDW